MGMALIFASHLYEVITAWGGGGGYTVARSEMCVPGRRRGCLVNPVPCYRREPGLPGGNEGEAVDAMLTRKASAGRVQVTVLKQTHVGEERILRRSSETS